MNGLKYELLSTVSIIGSINLVVVVVPVYFEYNVLVIRKYLFTDFFPEFITEV